ncbi:MAG: deoxyribodipyrimidine photo-lyase, partial [Bacteroidota bacterium]
MSTTAIYWLRNDLRLHDNETLVQAIEAADRVLPVYCIDPRQYQLLEYGFRKTGMQRWYFLKQCLQDLRRQLQSIGGDLLIRVGKPETILPALVEAYEVQDIFVQEEITSEETIVEAAVETACQKKGGTLHRIWGLTLYHRDDIPIPAGKTPLTSKSFRLKVVKPTDVRALLETPQKVAVPEVKDWGCLPEAHQLGFSEREIVAENTAYPGGEA